MALLIKQALDEDQHAQQQIKLELIMLRHYYVTDDLNELQKVESELEENGFTEPQIHVLSENDREVKSHDLNEVESVLKKDVVRSTEIGAVVGAIGAVLLLIIVYALGWYSSAAGWMPFIFLAIVILGFCTWEGGFIGIQEPNVNFRQFHEALKKGKHILFVDSRPEQEFALSDVMSHHPSLTPSGYGESTPDWVVKARDSYRNFVKMMP